MTLIPSAPGAATSGATQSTAFVSNAGQDADTLPMVNTVNTGTEVPHDAVAQSAFPPLDGTLVAPQLVWLAITFGALYLLMSRITLPRIGEVIEERRERIQRDLDSAERLKSETDKALASYEQALADARANANAIASETRDRLNERTVSRQAEVDAKIDAQIAEAERRIGQTRTKALSNVDEIASEVAATLVTELIDKTPSADEIKSAIAARSAR